MASERNLSPSGSNQADESDIAAAKLQSISIYGKLVDDVVVISHSNTALLLCLGTIDEEKALVLAPFVQLELVEATEDSAENEDRKPLFSKTLTLDNVAYLISDLARDFRAICSQLQDISLGNIKPDQARLELVRRFLSSARRSIDDSILELDKIKP